MGAVSVFEQLRIWESELPMREVRLLRVDPQLRPSHVLKLRTRPLDLKIHEVRLPYDSRLSIQDSDPTYPLCIMKTSLRRCQSKE